jgi:hypothetical protein
VASVQQPHRGLRAPFVARSQCAVRCNGASLATSLVTRGHTLRKSSDRRPIRYISAGGFEEEHNDGKPDCIWSTNAGLVREFNEDAFAIADLTRGRVIEEERVAQVEVGQRGILLAISDAMGGHQTGGVASALPQRHNSTDRLSGRGPATGRAGAGHLPGSS